MVYEANNSNLKKVLRKMDPLVMQLARNGTEEEKAGLITAFWGCWERTTSKKETPQPQAQAFYPVFQRFLPYLNDKEARIMLLGNVLLLGGAARNFVEIMAEFVGPDLQRFNLENSENYMQSIIDFLPLVNDSDLSGVPAKHLNILNEVALHLAANLTLRSLDNLSLKSLILPYLEEQTKQEVVSWSKSKFITADSTTKTVMVEALTHFLIDNLHYLSQEATSKLQEWALRLISGTDDVNRALGRALIEGTLHQLDKEEEQKARFMLRLFA